MCDHIAHPLNGAPLDTIAGFFPICLRKGTAKLDMHPKSWTILVK